MADSTTKPAEKSVPDPFVSLHERLNGLEQSLQAVRKMQEKLALDMQGLREIQRGTLDASQLLHQALMTWASSEPSQMWNETREWLHKAEQMVLDAQKPWTEEARKIWIEKVVEESTNALQEITAEYRERISTRANRAIVNMDRTAKKNMEEFADSLYEQHEKYVHEFEMAAEKTMREQTRAIAMENKQIMERLIGNLQEQAKAPGG
jgi:C-terminal processing protease CtpA/Prc